MLNLTDTIAYVDTGSAQMMTELIGTGSELEASFSTAFIIVLYTAHLKLNQAC